MENNSESKVYRILLALVSILLILVILIQCLYSAGIFDRDSQQEQEEDKDRGETTVLLSREGYELEQVVILSRHNIRSPLSGGDSLLGTITPHEWFSWTSNPSELSVRGGVLETEMGQYFRKWLEYEGFIPENYHPEEGEVRFYSNSKQRTIATAQYFSSGFLPTANVRIEYHMEFDKMDPVFTPQLTFVSPEYAADATEQIMEMYGDTIEGLKDNYELLSDVIDIEESPAWKDGSVTELVTDDIEIVLNEFSEPGSKGSLKTACTVSDALVLQYYEEPDPVKAGFGNDLTEEQWAAISEIKDVYGDVLFTAPLIAANVARPLLEEIQTEFTREGRKFTFLCGHDSNIGSVLAALGADAYELPDTIEKKTPIGCKLVMCRWKAPDGKKYYSMDLVYQTTDQLRNCTMLGLETPPAVFPVTLKTLVQNEDGLYQETDFMRWLTYCIDEYDRIMLDYGIQHETADQAA